MISLLLACLREPMEPKITPTKVASTFAVNWKTDAPGWSQVQYGPTPDYGYGSTPHSDTDDHSGVIFGVPEGETWHWRVVYRPTADDTDHEQVSADATLTGGPPPAELPPLTAYGDGLGDALILVPIVNNLSFVVIDGLGRYRWWYLDDSEEDTYYSLRASLGLDRQSFQYTLSTRGFDKDSQILTLDLAGQTTHTQTVFNGSHDFVETPYGYAALILDGQEVDGNTVKGDALVEIDPDGNLTQIFSTWDHFDSTTTGDPPPNWSHANSLDYDEESDQYLMGLRNFGSILAISREGQINWGFSGDANTFQFPQGGAFLTQHQFDLQGDQFLVYVNRWEEKQPTAIASYKLDQQAQVAEYLWSYDQNFSSNGFGSVAQLDDQILISWGTEGNLEVIHDQQQSFWLEVGESIGYASAFRYGERGLVEVAE